MRKQEMHAIFFLKNTMKLRLDPVLVCASCFLKVKMDKNDVVVIYKLFLIKHNACIPT